MFSLTLSMWLSALTVLSSSSSRSAHAYPVLLQIEEGVSRCFQFQIPEDDDAHLVGVALPGEVDIVNDKIEAWYFDQIFKLTAQKDQKSVLAKKFIDPMPNYVATQMSEYLQKTAGQSSFSPIQVSLSNAPNEDPDQIIQHARFFSPAVVNSIAHFAKSRNKRHERLDDDLGTYGICIKNRDENNVVQFIMDIVLMSEVVDDLGHTVDGSQFSKEKHLTPLEESLVDSISAAEAIIKEMSYLEQRERRMRVTAENINVRVHWFSYLSVSILLSVTYVQVTYLKRYFHKKKLM
jgi:p24 family protein delta-1